MLDQPLALRTALSNCSSAAKPRNLTTEVLKSTGLWSPDAAAAQPRPMQKQH